KAVARVNRIRPGQLRGPNQSSNVKVALFSVGRANADRFIGQLNVQGLGIRRRINRDRLQSQDPAGPTDPHRDLAAVGNQDLVEAPLTDRMSGLEYVVVDSQHPPQY